MERTPTNIRALLILEALSSSDRGMTPTEINESLGLPKQSIHRLCSYLEDLGFLVRDTNGKHLRPSARMRTMANGLLQNSHQHILRHQILKSVAEQVQETVNFVQPVEDGMRYRDRVETEWPFRIQLPVGSSVPFHCTASGKVFLASMTPQARRKFLVTYPLESLTPNTYTDIEKLLVELRTVAKQGYAIDNEEFMRGMVAIAVPVLDDQGRYFACVALHGPTQRLSLETVIDRKSALQTAAARLTDAIFI